MGIAARLLPLGLLLFAATGQGKDKEDKAVFTQVVAGVDIDWTAGTLTAQAGAAADMRMPGPNAARPGAGPGAERRARAQAEGKLAAALRTMVSGKQLDIESVVKRATVIRTEYQSDGGVFLWLGLGFARIAPARDAQRALKIASMPFAFAPTLASGGHTRRPRRGGRGCIGCWRSARLTHSGEWRAGSAARFRHLPARERMSQGRGRNQIC